MDLVTGGAGFIGSHLVESLVTQGHRVRVLDNFSTGRRENLAAIRPVPEIIEADLTDAAVLTHAMRDVEVVFHLGALASVQRSIEDPLTTHHICATGTLRILEAARHAGVRRVVYAGSASAYGVPTSDVQNETDPLRALSPYAAAKLAGEWYMQAFAATYGLETVCLRFFNIYGPRQRVDSPYSGVIALFARALLEGKTPTIYGDGLQSRDFTYIEDVVQALQKAAVASTIQAQTYNIGTGQSVTVLDLVEELNHLLGTQILTQHGPVRLGDVRHSRADITRARRDLGYEPRISFREGLQRTLHWYQEEAKAYGGSVT